MLCCKFRPPALEEVPVSQSIDPLTPSESWEGRWAWPHVMEGAGLQGWEAGRGPNRLSLWTRKECGTIL